MGEKDDKIVKLCCVGCIGIIVIVGAWGYINQHFQPSENNQRFQPSENPDKLIDNDHDGFSKYFEEKVMGTSDGVPNERYIILSSSFGSFDKQNPSYDIAKVSFESAKNFAIKNHVAEKNINIIMEATYNNFSHALKQTLKNANENDVIFIDIHSDSDKNGFSFIKENATMNKQYSVNSFYDFYEIVPYVKVAGLFNDNIKPKIIISNEGCSAGAFLDYVKNPNVTILAQVNADQTAMALDMLDFSLNSYGAKLSDRIMEYKTKYPNATAFKHINPDTNGNGGTSVGEAFDVSAVKIRSIWYDYANPDPRQPMISNRELADRTYLFETDSNL